MPPEWCGQKAEEARYCKQRPGIRPELVKSQNCHTRNVLGCHRNDKERDGNPDQTGDGKYRRNKYRVWPERADGNALIGRENNCHHCNEYSRRNRKQPLEPGTTAQTITIGNAIRGICATAFTGARHSINKIPASIAFAIDAGIAATARASGFHCPATTTNTPATTNAPTAAGNPPATICELASNAAPGVDHATEIGNRVFKLRNRPQMPIAIETAIRPDAASASEAPTARNPCTTTANELAKPTKAASNPAEAA